MSDEMAGRISELVSDTGKRILGRTEFTRARQRNTTDRQIAAVDLVVMIAA
jgi:hypothetical protein